MTEAHQAQLPTPQDFTWKKVLLSNLKVLAICVVAAPVLVIVYLLLTAPAHGEGEAIAIILGGAMLVNFMFPLVGLCFNYSRLRRCRQSAAVEGAAPSLDAGSKFKIMMFICLGIVGISLLGWLIFLFPIFYDNYIR